MALQKETSHIIQPFTILLQARGWYQVNIHGNQYQEGLPDKYICHHTYTPRWWEAKVIDSYGYIHLTPAQKRRFPILISMNVPVYIIAARDLRGLDNKSLRERLYQKLLDEPNGQYALDRRLHKLLY